MRPAVDGVLLARPAAAVLVVAGAALAAAPVFAGARAQVVLVGAVAVGGVAVMGAAHAVRGTAGRVVVGTVAVLAYVGLVLAPGRQVLDGPRRLLTGALPLEPSGPELAAVAVLTGIAAATAAALARPPRPEVAALPGLATYALVSWVGAAAPAPGPTALVLVLVGAGGLLATTRPRRAGTTARRGPALAGGRRSPARPAWVPGAVAALVTVGLVAAGTATVSGRLPGSDVRARPADARDLVAEPVQVRRATSPLARYPALVQGPDRVLFTVTPAGGAKPRAARPLLLRWVTLDRFDGQTWTSAARFQRAGRTLPGQPALDVPTTATTVRIELADGAEATWLPSVGRAVSLSVAGLGVDPQTGDVAVPVDRSPPATYDVVGTRPKLRAALLRAAVGAPLPAAHALPEVPERIRSAATQAAGAATTAFGRLAGLESYLSGGDFTVATGPEPPTGHGLFQVQRLLRERSGTAEQYASAFAVMGRVLGFDTRVVVGFRADAARGGWTARTRGLQAWPEVDLDGLGWVAFQPVPSRTSEGTEQPRPPAARSAVDRAVDQERASAGDTTPPTAAPAPVDGGGSPWDWLLRTAAFVLVLVGVVALGLSVVPLAKAARRRSRRLRPDARDRVLGAWLEATDRIAELGLPVQRSMSRPEVAGAAAASAPSAEADLHALARLADDAGFAPSGPALGADEAAWARVAAVTAALRPSTVAKRARAAVDPRPLLRR